MRWRIKPGMAIAAMLTLWLAVSAKAQDTRPGIAVLRFDNGGSYGKDKEDFEALRVGLQQMMVTEFAANSKLRTVERSKINNLVAEQDLGTSGRVDPETAAKLGKLVGARYMVMGSFIDFYGDLQVDLRVVDVETGEIIRTARQRDKRENLFELVTELAHNITGKLELPQLSPAAFKDRQSRSKPPREALKLYMRAVMWEDRGDSEKARELYGRALKVFPAYTDAREGLQHLEQSS